jgi:hypothetical protein
MDFCLAYSLILKMEASKMSVGAKDRTLHIHQFQNFNPANYIFLYVNGNVSYQLGAGFSCTGESYHRLPYIMQEIVRYSERA